MTKLGWGIVLVLTAGVQDVKRPMPEPPAQKEAEKRIRELFRQEYAKRAPTDKVALAQKLIQQAREVKDDPATRYVLLREAQDLATQADAARVALEAVDLLDKFFIVNAPVLRLGVLAAAAKTAKTSDDAKLLAPKFLSLVDEALGTDQFDVAEKAADAAQAQARKSKDLPLMTRAEAKVKEIADRKAKAEKLKKAREALVRNPDDGEANFLVGRQVCYVSGRWEEGLRLLAKGSDLLVKAIALKDMASPTDPAAQVAVGDHWWDLSDKEEEPAKTNLRARAGVWYERAASRAGGSDRERAEKRLAEVREDRLGSRRQWVTLTDPRPAGVPAKPGEPVVLKAAAGKAFHAILEGVPPGEHDGFSARVRFGEDRKSHGGLLFESDNRIAYVDSESNTFIVARMEGAKWIKDFEKECPRRDLYAITVLLTAGEYVLYLDAVEQGRLKTTLSRMVQIGLQTSHGVCTFEHLRVRRKD